MTIIKIGFIGAGYIAGVRALSFDNTVALYVYVANLTPWNPDGIGIALTCRERE